MSKINDWLGLGDIINKILKTIDSLSTTEEEKAKAKKELTEVVSNFAEYSYKLQESVLRKEMGGSWLQKNWRPLTMLSFTAVVIVSVFLDSTVMNLPESFWGLLKIGIGGYIGGRTLEKITENVTKNADITSLKKKDRKGLFNK